MRPETSTPNPSHLGRNGGQFFGSPGETAPDLLGRDCDGGSLPRRVVRVEPDGTTRVEVSPFHETRNSPVSETTVTDDPTYSGLGANPSLEPNLSDQALALVNGDRQDAYGEPVEHCEKVAAVWRAMFGWDVDGHKFSIAMAALKLVREQNRPKKDSRVDTVGWMEIADRIVTANEARP